MIFCLYRDRTFTRTILVRLAPDCREEALAEAGWDIYIKTVEELVHDVSTGTVTRTILVQLTLGCQEETLGIASRVLPKDIVEKLSIYCCQ